MRQAMWRIALEPQVILPTSAYSIQHATRRTAPSPLWGMLRFHSSFYCTPQARFRFRKPPSGTARIGKGKGVVSVCAASARPQSYEPRRLSGDRKSKTHAQTFTFPYFWRKVAVCAWVLNAEELAGDSFRPITRFGESVPAGQLGSGPARARWLLHGCLLALTCLRCMGDVEQRQAQQRGGDACSEDGALCCKLLRAGAKR